MFVRMITSTEIFTLVNAKNTCENLFYIMMEQVNLVELVYKIEMQIRFLTLLLLLNKIKMIPHVMR